MSLDQVGPLSSDVYGAALLLSIMAGKSGNDPSTIARPVDTYAQFSRQKLTIGLSKDFEQLTTDKRIYGLVKDATTRLAKAYDCIVSNVSLEHIDLALYTYYPLVYVEFFSSTRKLDGRKYGRKIEESCGEEVLRRILGGKEISKAEHHGTYYRKALQAKKVIAHDFDQAFKKVDIILSPVTPVLPHKLGTMITDPKVIYAYDALTIPANLAGICAGVVPMGKIDGIPVGLQVNAPAFAEKRMFDVMKMWEEIRRDT